MISNYLYFPLVHRKGELSQNLIPLMIFSFFPLCDSEAIRTLDPRLRRALLYPAELRNRPCFMKTVTYSVFVCKDSVFIFLYQGFFYFFVFLPQKIALIEFFVFTVLLVLFSYHFRKSSASLFSDGIVISLRWSSIYPSSCSSFNAFEMLMRAS